MSALYSYVFNPFTSKFDVVTGPSYVPTVVPDGNVYVVSNNTQVVYASPIIINAGGTILTVGSGVLVGVQ